MNEVKWIVAILAPQDIAPHPNFSVGSVDAPELLALASQYRNRDYSRYRDTVEASTWESNLCDAAFKLLSDKNNSSGLSELITVFGNDSRPLGARAAATLLVSYIHAYRDSPESSIEVIENLLREIPHDHDDPSTGIIQTALWQHLSLRFLEAGWRNGAVEYAQQVINSADHLAALEFESFRVSSGVGWTSYETQQDILHALIANARAMLSRLEGPRGQGWVSVVKAAVPRLHARLNSRIAGALEVDVRSAFEDHTKSLQRSSRFYIEDPVSTALNSSYLFADLSGAAGESSSIRELIAQLRLLEVRSDEHESEASDAIRLMRLSGKDKSLDVTLRWIRAAGPISALRGEAVLILQRPSFPERVSRSDVAVLMLSAELLEPEERRRAIDALFSYQRGDPRDGFSTSTFTDWAREEYSWRAIARLVSDSGADENVAHRALQYLDQHSEDPTPFARAFTELADSLNWSAVEQTTRESWVSWCLKELRTSSPSSDLADKLLDSIAGPSYLPNMRVETTGLSKCIHLLRQQADGVDLESSDVDTAIDECISAMRQVVSDAEGGRFSYGGYNPADIGCALAVSFGKDEIWPEILRFLANPHVMSRHKESALIRMSDSPEAIPSSLIPGIRDAWDNYATPRRTDLFDTTALPFVPGAVRLAGALRLFPREDLINLILRLSTEGGARGKIEAARSIQATLMRQNPAEWGIALLLQLSYDPDPMVRGQAGQSLSHLTLDQSALADLVTSRVTELISSDGLLIPLMALRGLIDSRGGNVRNAVAREVLIRLSTESPASSIRKLAVDLLSRRSGNFDV